VKLDDENRNEARHGSHCCRAGRASPAHYDRNVHLALKIAPQHSTQYADMAARLAVPELLASPAGKHVSEVDEASFGGQAYLLARIEAGVTLDELMRVLSRLGATSGVFECFDELGGLPGPFLRPVPPAFTPFVPRQMAEARRYKGKTSEVFAQVLLNLAVFGGRFRERLTERLRVLDPLAGGGTTLFLALAAGYDAFGVDVGGRSVETTATFVREYCREERISHTELRERAKRRHTFEVGPRDDRRLLVLAEGDARHVETELRDARGGARFHALAADLPYGIQHAGEARRLVADAVPAWERVLVPGAALALAWDATRLTRDTLAATVREHSGLVVRDDGPYTQLEHRVDRVIKRRDVLVAVRPAD
jgi:SAM-dependent methyltransferase